MNRQLGPHPEFEGDIDFIPKIYRSPFGRDEVQDSGIKPDTLFDELISKLNVSSLDSVLKTGWNSTRDPFRSPSYGDVATIEAKSRQFVMAGNMTRLGYASASEVQGNSNEVVLSGNLRMPVPKIEMDVSVWNKEGEQTTLDVTAVSSRDVVMGVQLILNKQWKKIFVTNIAPKEIIAFRANFKCNDGMSFDFCKQMQDVLNRDVLSRIDGSIRDALKFKLEEMEPDM